MLWTPPWKIPMRELVPGCISSPPHLKDRKKKKKKTKIDRTTTSRCQTKNKHVPPLGRELKEKGKKETEHRITTRPRQEKMEKGKDE